MSRNGSGTYVLPAGQPAITGTTISSSTFNTLTSDLASALTQSVAVDGQSVITANLPMAGFKFTGLGAGSGTGESLRYEQLFSQGTELDIASASTVNIGAQNTNFLRITGTTTITSLGTSYNGPRFVRFAGALTLTHDASTLILPGGANIVTAAGDTAIFYPKATTGTPDGWECVSYQRASGFSLLGSDTTRADIASAATLDLTTVSNTRNINITGTTTITAVTVPIGQLYFVRFNAALTLTNNAAIVTNTGANITTAAGDTCIFRATAANTIEVLSYGYTPAIVAAQFNASGTAPLYACRAWVNFNGTGTVAIMASGNVSSITDNGPGEYTVNLATSMPDAYYAVSCTTVNRLDDTNVSIGLNPSYPKTSASVRIIQKIGSTGGLTDSGDVSVLIIR